MTEEKLSEILKLLTGIKLYEWKSIEKAVKAVNYEFSTMSNRLELADTSRIQREIKSEIIH